MVHGGCRAIGDPAVMAHDGLAKLVEELGELSQVAGKLLAYRWEEHPDGGPPLVDRLRDESGDVIAAIRFVCGVFGVPMVAVGERAQAKFDKFEEWR